MYNKTLQFPTYHFVVHLTPIIFRVLRSTWPRVSRSNILTPIVYAPKTNTRDGSKKVITRASSSMDRQGHEGRRPSSKRKAKQSSQMTPHLPRLKTIRWRQSKASTLGLMTPILEGNIHTCSQWTCRSRGRTRRIPPRPVCWAAPGGWGTRRGWSRRCRRTADTCCTPPCPLCSLGILLVYICVLTNKLKWFFCLFKTLERVALLYLY